MRKKCQLPGYGFFVISSIYLVVLLSLFAGVSYTWFSLSQNPKVSSIQLSVQGQKGLELSWDPAGEHWEQQLDFTELAEDVYSLQPVTWSQQEQRFYACTYGRDGRLTDQWEALEDDLHANRQDVGGYYVMGTFYARCDESATVSLLSASQLPQGQQGDGTYLTGVPLWNGQKRRHENGGFGAELAMRVGFQVQTTDLAGVPLQEEPCFYIYEPNGDVHLDGSTGWVDTPGQDGRTSLIPQDNLILQSANTWQEADPVRQGTVIRETGEFLTDTALFAICEDELVRITVYIWLEGQDVDCTNQIGNNAKITANLQLYAAFEDRQGPVTIED